MSERERGREKGGEREREMSEHIPDCFVVQYAHDTQILLTVDTNNTRELIERAVSSLSPVKLCFQRNGLLLNESKT